MTDDTPNLAEQMRLSQEEDAAKAEAAHPATEGYTGKPCVRCGRNRVFLRRDGQYECEKCETIQPAPLLIQDETSNG